MHVLFNSKKLKFSFAAFERQYIYEICIHGSNNETLGHKVVMEVLVSAYCKLLPDKELIHDYCASYHQHSFP